MANIPGFKIDGVRCKIDYNALANLPDLGLKADKSDTYTKAQVDTAVGAKYAKPSSGIPKTDLESSVQDTLNATVKSVAQTLSDEQKAQARKNLDIGVRLVLNNDGTVCAVED